MAENTGKTLGYTAETVAALVSDYAEARNAGEMNGAILDRLSVKFDRTVPSLRTKLMVEKAYVKDTDTEKEVKASAKIPKASGKTAKVTKLDTAKMVFAALKIEADAETVKDFSKVKASTLALFLAAVGTDIDVTVELDPAA